MPIDPSTYPILEQATGEYAATFVANDGATVLTASALLTLTLTLYVVKQDGTTAYVNSRNAQTVLNANNVTVSGAGRMVWSIQAADTTLVEAVPFERHIALFEWTWANGQGKKEVILVVQGLGEV